jgi:hydrogenase maturation protein HypF
MKRFAMCLPCRAEYENPADRRFHAETNACPACGPRIELWDRRGSRLAAQGEALSAAADALRRSAIVAVKGLGGFHLLVGAGLEHSVRRLRQRKHREARPLALMFPTLAAVMAACIVNPLEAGLLTSPEAPIVLLHRTAGAAAVVAPAVAADTPLLGVMLPSNPLHHLLMSELATPVVATSGNLSAEPICTDEHEALRRLGDLADLFLVHDRPIVRHVDDSLVRVVAGRELVLRRARGYAPLPVQLRTVETGAASATSVLAMGGHLKSVVALGLGSEVFLSQHIGDLETVESGATLARVVADLEALHGTSPDVVVADLHPDYLSTRYARDRAAVGRSRHLGVQHHVAHVLAGMAENQLAPPVLGVAWDGTGYGPDGMIRGGEFLAVTSRGVERVAALRAFPLPGGEQAVREPRRAALGLLFAAFGDVRAREEAATLGAFSELELRVLHGMLRRNLNSPLVSSVGRLFDAVASLIGLRQRASYEGQAAMALEFAVDGAAAPAYPVALRQDVVDWAPMLDAVLDDLGAGRPVGVIAARFHHGLVESLVAVARRAGLEHVVLSGGCFQNAYLTERAVSRLREAGFHPAWHQRVPPNDGGLALGQVAAARWAWSGGAQPVITSATDVIAAAAAM